MTENQARAVLNDSKVVAAYGQYFRDPMGTDPETYRLACDWLQAALVVSAANCEPERSEGEL